MRTLPEQMLQHFVTDASKRYCSQCIILLIKKKKKKKTEENVIVMCSWPNESKIKATIGESQNYMLLSLSGKDAKCKLTEF